jgi:rhodanese-related sulfurtransferase
MRREFSFVLVLFLLASWAFADAPEPSDKLKCTALGKYSTAAEAHEKWKASPDGVKIVDVRTPEEYVYVGHATMALNIPIKLWAGKWDAEKKDVVLADNPDFVKEAKARLKPTDTVFVMCQAGRRGAKAVDALAKEGFTNVYNVTEGFEGDKITDEESIFKGKRIRNGWKNSGLPWTYEVDVNLTTLPAK